DPAPAVRAASYARVLLELVGAVCLALVIAAAFPRWWQVLLVALAALTTLATVVVALLPRVLGRRSPVQVLALGGPAVLMVQRALTPMIATVRRLGRRRRRSPAEDLQEETENLRDMVGRVGESDQN